MRSVGYVNRENDLHANVGAVGQGNIFQLSQSDSVLSQFSGSFDFRTGTTSGRPKVYNLFIRLLYE